MSFSCSLTPGMSTFITLISGFAPSPCECGVVHRHHSSQGMANEDFGGRPPVLPWGVPEFKHGMQIPFEGEAAGCAALLHQALNTLYGSLRMVICWG